jgi:predicted DNA-binding protein (MmcQ/YjbR family)
MEREELRAYCLSQKGAVEEYPFGDDAAVFKVMGKMFALMPVNGATSISLKCDPDLATMLRNTYPAVTAAYHMNKRHWNGILVDGSIPDDEIYGWVDHAYDLVVKGLTRSQKAQLAEIEG